MSHYRSNIFISSPSPRARGLSSDQGKTRSFLLNCCIFTVDVVLHNSLVVYKGVGAENLTVCLVC